MVFVTRYRLLKNHKKLTLAAVFSILSVITIIVTPSVLNSLNETKSVGQHILELSDEIKQSRDGGKLKLDSLSLDYHSKKYKRLSIALDIVAFGSLAAAFILSFLSMLKKEHKYAHYIIWLVCAVTIAIKLTFMIAGIALLVFIVIAAFTLSGG